MVRKFLSKVLRFEDPVVQQVNKFVVHMDGLGTTGTESYGGYASEEYLYNLRGTDRADIFDKMRRSDGTIKMCLSAVKAPIRSAMWEIRPNEELAEIDPASAEADAELIEQILFRDMETSFDKFLGEALSFVDFGHSVFEMIDKPVLNHPTLGSYNSLRALAYRSPRTIHRWNLDPITDRLLSVTQIANGDLGVYADIPAEFLLVFSLDQEGSNYEGISGLRCCYGNWFRKNHYLKLNAIGIEKFAIPTPTVEVPDGKEGTDQFDNLIEALKKYVTHQNNYLTIPAGWKLTLNNNVYDPQKVETSIDNEDKRMVKSFMANFLELGLNGTGSHSLSFDLSDFFLSTLDHLACEISSGINKIVIPRLIEMNRGPRAGYPCLHHSGISDRAGKELADVVKTLSDANVLTADDVLEANMRKRYGLPAFDPTTQRKRPAPVSVNPQAAMSERTNLLMDKIKHWRVQNG